MLVLLPHVCLVPLPELPGLVRVEHVQHLAYVNMIPLQQPKEGVDLVLGKFGLRVICGLATQAFMLRRIRVWGGYLRPVLFLAVLRAVPLPRALGACEELVFGHTTSAARCS